MSNNVAEIKERLDKLKNEAVDIALIEGKKIGIGLAAVIKRRVLNKGISANNTLFSPYSDKYKKYLAKKNRGTKNGLEFVKNFEFTGDMWANFGTPESVDVKKLSNNIVRITLKGGSEDSQNKIDWNSEREEKSIIEPTDDELNDAKNDFIESLSNELQLLINVG